MLELLYLQVIEAMIENLPLDKLLLMSVTLTDTLQIIPGIGPLMAQKLARLQINNLTDLLLHLPYRYQDRTRVTAICDLQPNEWAVVVGKIINVEQKIAKKRMLLCHIADKTGSICLRFFHYNLAQVKRLQAGSYLYAFGEARAFNNTLVMVHPTYQHLTSATEISVAETLTPIYSTTQGLAQTKLRQWINYCLTNYTANLNWPSDNYLAASGLMPIQDALNLVHNPPPDIALAQLEQATHPALQRLIIEELLSMRISMHFAKQKRRMERAPAFQAVDMTNFIQSLPFTLTNAQQKVATTIQDDLQQGMPMRRLVQGDVGAGKTVIAAIAALMAIKNNFQVALMAPTELLAEQHYQQMHAWLMPLGIIVERLSASLTTSVKKATLKQLATNHIHLVIGTHALFQQAVEFHNLGLVVIDEQHRFGVAQRLLLQQKAHISPHQLLLTATPIPRTLAMTNFAHLDISIIDELPKGRQPIHTAVIEQTQRDAIIQRLSIAIAKQHQAYWVCTLIEDSEKLQCMAAEATQEKLQQALPDARIALVHGRLKAPQKEAIMRAFKAGDIDLLVATTVIEVGVDVPNATLMIIENAERLGLAQLHQLRGRVGRGTQQSYCLLLYQSPLTASSRARLKTLRATTDGFIIAEEDLKIRGSGEFLGTRQAGHQVYKIANLARDHHLLPQVNQLATKFLEENAELAQQVAAMWQPQSDDLIKA